MRRLSDQVVVVTGGSRGLGRAIALAAAREGAGVSICARGHGALQSVAAEIRRLGAEALPIAADLRSERDIERVVALTLERFDRVDILVNNASELGPTPLPHLVDYPGDAFTDVLLVNVVAPFRLTRALLGGMLQRGQGLVINVTSDVAGHGYPGWGAYAVSKAALEGLTRTWAAELQGTGVRMHAVDPSDMDTAMHRAAVPDADPQDLTRPEDVAEAFIRLAAEGPPEADAWRLDAPKLLATASVRE